MGSGEDGTPTKSSKPASSLQETSSAPTTPVYPDWSSSMQAFYGPGATPPFFAPPVGSSTPHPFLWGGQHPLMPPYGTPVYPAMYPPGGVYAHPSMVMNPGNIHGTAELDGKANERKDNASIKKNKGTSGNNGSIGARTGDGGKAASGSGNDVGTQSGESGSEEGSSDASDDNNQDFSKTKKGSFDQMLMDGANAQNNSVPSNLQPLAARNSVASVPPTNLNIGMDLWNASQAGSGPMPSHLNQNVPPHVAPSGMDERELKRQKRKQSNRESARRSRLRKQAECEELQHRVEMLSNENHTLRDELRRLSEECEKLTSENNSIKAELVRLYGPEAVSKLEDNNPTADDGQSHDENGN